MIVDTKPKMKTLVIESRKRVKRICKDYKKWITSSLPSRTKKMKNSYKIITTSMREIIKMRGGTTLY